MIFEFLEFICAQPIAAIRIKIGYNSVKYFVKKIILPAIEVIKMVKNVAKNTLKKYLLILLESILDLIIIINPMLAGIRANKIKPILITSL